MTTITSEQFIKKYLGKRIDTDNYPASQKYQCVDLIKGYIEEVLGVNAQSIGNAIQYWKKRNNKYLSSLFVPIKNTPEFVPKRFDIVIFDRGNDTGHIAICTGEGDTHSFCIWQQNSPKTASPVNKATVNYKQVAGFLRPIHLQYNINRENATHIMKVYSPVYIDSNRKTAIDKVQAKQFVKCVYQGSINAIVLYSNSPNGQYNMGIVKKDDLIKV